MTIVRSIADCCKRHMDALIKSKRLDVTVTSAVTFELTFSERDCLYACNGYYPQCENYVPYRESLKGGNLECAL